MERIVECRTSDRGKLKLTFTEVILQVSAIKPRFGFNGYDYGGVGYVCCTFDNSDDGTPNFWANQSFWFATFLQLNYLFPLLIFHEMYWKEIRYKLNIWASYNISDAIVKMLAIGHMKIGYVI